MKKKRAKLEAKNKPISRKQAIEELGLTGTSTEEVERPTLSDLVKDFAAG